MASIGCKTIDFTLFAPNSADFQEFWGNMAIPRLNPPFPGGSNGIQHLIFAINVKFIVQHPLFPAIARFLHSIPVDGKDVLRNEICVLIVCICVIFSE